MFSNIKLMFSQIFHHILFCPIRFYSIKIIMSCYKNQVELCNTKLFFLHIFTLLFSVDPERLPDTVKCFFGVLYDVLNAFPLAMVLFTAFLLSCLVSCPGSRKNEFLLYKGIAETLKCRKNKKAVDFVVFQAYNNQ